jgi:hypothetical protein
MRSGRFDEVTVPCVTRDNLRELTSGTARHAAPAIFEMAKNASLPKIPGDVAYGDHTLARSGLGRLARWTRRISIAAAWLTPIPRIRTVGDRW